MNFTYNFQHLIIVDNCVWGSDCRAFGNKSTRNFGVEMIKCNRKHPGESLEDFHNRVTKNKTPLLPDEVLPFSAKYTKMCKNIINNNECTLSDCQYAHKIEELVLSDCGFAKTCIHVKLENGVYINTDAKNKVCVRRHHLETPENVVSRRTEEIEKPSYSLFPKGTTIKIESGKTIIKTSQEKIVDVFQTALINGITNVQVIVKV